MTSKTKGTALTVLFIGLIIAFNAFMLWIIWNLPGWLEIHVGGWGFVIGAIIDVFFIVILIASWIILLIMAAH